MGTGRFVESAGLVAGRRDLGQVLFDSGRVEIDVGYRGEQAFEHGTIDLRVADAELGRSVGVHRQPLGGVDQEVLQGGGFRVFSANADLLAPGALGGLFALVTKHGMKSLFVERNLFRCKRKEAMGSSITTL